jgi:hypothetical protein
MCMSENGGNRHGVDGMDVYTAPRRFFPSSSLVHGEVAMGFKMCNYYRRGEDGELERMRRGSVVYRLMSDFKGERNE